MILRSLLIETASDFLIVPLGFAWHQPLHHQALPPPAQPSPPDCPALPSADAGTLCLCDVACLDFLPSHRRSRPGAPLRPKCELGFQVQASLLPTQLRISILVATACQPGAGREKKES